MSMTAMTKLHTSSVVGPDMIYEFSSGFACPLSLPGGNRQTLAKIR